MLLTRKSHVVCLAMAVGHLYFPVHLTLESLKEGV